MLERDLTNECRHARGKFYACARAMLIVLMAVTTISHMPAARANAQHDRDIVDTAIAAGSFQTLVAALTAADLVDDLRGPGPFTVFAPTDAAFAKLPPGTVANLLKPENKAALIKILTYHVVPGHFTSSDLAHRSSLTTLQGEDVKLRVDNQHRLFVNDSQVIQADVRASNGIIHAIDTVLIPPSNLLKDIVDTAVAAGNFTTLVTAVQAAGLVDTLRGPGPFTVFAPTDAAFAKLPADLLAALLLPTNKGKLVEILTYHVLAGRVLASDAFKLNGQEVATLNGKKIKISVRNHELFINDSKVIKADVLASNGVIHAIDAVLIPPGFVPPAPPPALKDIVDTAIAAGNFKTLVAALIAADLVNTLRGPGPFTVFAPTDDAFARLPADLLNALLLPENKGKLQEILTYHVLAGKVLASDAIALDGQEVATVNGAKIKISVRNGDLFINESKVVAADVLASNGVIHAIDAVLIPPGFVPPAPPPVLKDIVDTAIAAGQFNTLVAALTAADLVDDLRGPGPFTVFAPTDDAFAKLPPAIIAALLKPENKAILEKVLLYHVAAGKLLSGDVLALDGKEAATLSGEKVKINVRDGKLFLNDAEVIAADVLASNGVIHVIDTVLIPPSLFAGLIDLKINFQPANAEVPADYLADSGQAFGPRDGFAYGWNKDNTRNTRDRNSVRSPDQRFDTFAFMQKGGRRHWEVQVPNGRYAVKVVAGDPSFFNSLYRINVEGVRAINEFARPNTRWFSGTVTVDVKDGKLTLSNARNAINNKVAFIEIASVTDSAAAQAVDNEALPQEKLGFESSTTVMPAGIQLNWSVDTASGVTGFRVFRGTTENRAEAIELTDEPLSASSASSAGIARVAQAVNRMSFSHMDKMDTLAPADGMYHYWVVAIGANGEAIEAEPFSQDLADVTRLFFPMVNVSR